VKRAIFVPRTDLGMVVKKLAETKGFLRKALREARRRARGGTPRRLQERRCRTNFVGARIVKRRNRTDDYAGRAFTFKPPSRMIFAPL
jgi:hypothetical protein